MANHAYVIPTEFPTIEQINHDTKEICSRKFPEFTLEFTQNDSFSAGVWTLSYKDSPELHMMFWIDTWNDVPCIEFRHGHYGAGDWLWWMEYEIREELAQKYNAQVVDDADGIPTNPETKRFNTSRTSTLDRINNDTLSKLR